MIVHDVSPPSPPSPPSRPGVSAGPSIRLGIICCAPSPSAAATYSRIKAQLCASPHSLQLCRSGRRARGGATQLDFLRLSAESEKKPESIRRHQKIPSEVPEKPPVATARSYNTNGHSNQDRSEWPIAKGRDEAAMLGRQQQRARGGGAEPTAHIVRVCARLMISPGLLRSALRLASTLQEIKRGLSEWRSG